jgi:hypothetical protein
MPYGLMNRIPYTLPQNKLPVGKRCIQITIPDDDEWENQLYSLILAEFGRWLMWERDTGKNGTKIAAQWRHVLSTWVHCDNSPVSFTFGEDEEMPALYEPYCRDDGTCGFHFRCDICGDWHDVATADQLGSSTSPGAGTPQPGPNGGAISVCKKLQANGTLLLAAQVSSGDTVEIVSASGSGNDGGEAFWRCPDGGIYIGGLCDDPAIYIPGGDPVNDKPHMSLILMVNGTAYPFYTGASPWTPVVITIPGGVSNAYAEIQVNDSDITNNKGDYAICYKQTNNQAGTWSHTFDFRLNQYGWVVQPTEGGAWVPGVGFQSSVVSAAPTTDQIVIDSPALPSGTYTAFSVLVNCAQLGGNAVLYNQTTSTNTSLTQVSGDHTYAFTHVINSGNVLAVEFDLNPYSVVGGYIIKSATLSGTGVDPF